MTRFLCLRSVRLPSPVVLRKMNSYKMIAIKEWLETIATEIVGIFNNTLIIKNKRATLYGSGKS
jgi:hypothetical protein